ncbi:MAG: hypothetical protein PV344_01105, partial [Anaplasma sp.]|nr:hypothetical protein [Anaplasma sp.]
PGFFTVSSPSHNKLGAHKHGHCTHATANTIKRAEQQHKQYHIQRIYRQKHRKASNSTSQ